MNSVLSDLSLPGLLEAMHNNFAQEMVAFGRGLPRAHVYEDDELLSIYTGRPNLNAVLQTRFKRSDPAYIDTRVAQTLDFYRERGVGVGWLIGPLTRPANLSIYLQAHGFFHATDKLGMAVDLSAVHENVPTCSALVIREAYGRENLKPVFTLEMEGFGMSAREAQLYYDAYVNIGSGPRRTWRHYIGWLEGKPVAMASLLLHGGVAGIYGVTTLPEVRRQGVATSMMLHLLHQAREMGYCIAMLSPTDMSFNLYRRMGFQEYYTFAIYVWSPLKK